MKQKQDVDPGRQNAGTLQLRLNRAERLALNDVADAQRSEDGRRVVTMTAVVLAALHANREFEAAYKVRLAEANGKD